MSLAKTFLAIGIAIIFALFIGYGLYVVYESPSYKDYEGNYEEFKKVRDQYDLNISIILTIIGAVAITAGILLSPLESIGSGILGGGILTVIYGVVVSWTVLNKYLRLAILFAILILLIYLGYKKIEKKGTKKR